VLDFENFETQDPPVRGFPAAVGDRGLATMKDTITLTIEKM
jgi:hypothetical protein